MKVTPVRALFPERDPTGLSIPRDDAARALNAVHDVGELIAREPDSHALLLALAPLMARIFGAEQAIVATVHEDTVSRIVPHGLAANDLSQLGPISETLEWVAVRRQTFVADAPQESLPGSGVSLADVGWHQVLACPVLHHAGHAIGVVLIANRLDRRPTDAAELRLLEALAAQIVVGLDRAQLLGRLDEWSRSLEALLAFSAAVHQQHEPLPLVDELVKHAAQFVKADGGRGGLVITDAQQGTLALESSSYWSDGVWIERRGRWARNAGIPGRVLESEFPFLTADYASDAGAEPELIAQYRVGHALCVPIKDASHTVIGFFELHRLADRAPFTWNDATFLESLADTTAMAIENSRLVTALAVKNDEIRQLFARHAQRLEEERQHVARELHDEAGQALVGVKLSLQALSRAIPEGMPTVRLPLDELRAQVNQATARLRQLARRLRPPTLDQHGLSVALAQLVHEFEERSGMTITLDTEWLPERRLPLVETAVFRIVQEALTNVAAHAEATRVTVMIGECESALWIRVTDNGRGFDPSSDSPGLGLRGIAERAHMLRGDYHVDTERGRGTTLWVRLPVS